jgi:hypothetical protein
LDCKQSFVWKIPANSLAQRQHWFELWVSESLSIRFLCKLSGYSKSKLEGIKDLWLKQPPEEWLDLSGPRYLVYDATYFHKDGCLLSLMDAIDQRIISQTYVQKESFRDAYHWFTVLKHQGLKPAFITTDGERSVMRAMRLVWPDARLQRCLYHLQHEGMRWLRSHPANEAGRELRRILGGLSSIKTTAERDSFVRAYLAWKGRYEEYMLSLPCTVVAFKDLKRTVVLLDNALPDMFYYLEDGRVHPTTNALENFHSRLKADYQRHRGLSKVHRIAYLRWYSYFKNKAISNTF